jgi:hypothetical protein
MRLSDKKHVLDKAAVGVWHGRKHHERPGAPSFVFFAKGGIATVGIEIRGIPPFAKSAKDGAPGEKLRFVVSNAFPGGAPHLPQRPYCKNNGGAFPDFLWGVVESRSFMRLSLQKAAHANLGGAAFRESGSPVFFGPRAPGRTWDTRRLSLGPI